jgi:hypothetical protein
MGESGLRHALAALYPRGKEPPVPIGQESGWAPELLWTHQNWVHYKITNVNGFTIHVSQYGATKPNTLSHVSRGFKSLEANAFLVPRGSLRLLHFSFSQSHCVASVDADSLNGLQYRTKGAKTSESLTVRSFLWLMALGSLFNDASLVTRLYSVADWITSECWRIGKVW